MLLKPSMPPQAPVPALVSLPAKYAVLEVTTLTALIVAVLTESVNVPTVSVQVEAESIKAKVPVLILRVVGVNEEAV